MNRSIQKSCLTGTCFLLALWVMGCSDDPTRLVDSDPSPDPPPGDSIPTNGDPSTCSIPSNLIFNGASKDGIPALTNPLLVSVEDPGTGYLLADDRVVGLDLESGPIALPLNIFWWHEIVNLEVGGRAMAITHCPLTGSSVGFDRAAVEGAEFGVSGLLYQNNLIMYDRTGDESLWPQMLLGARCGPRKGDDLPTLPIVEMTWEAWRTLHPQTLVVSEDTGFNRDYTRYPYGGYDLLDDASTLFPAKIDPRRPPKELVLGIPSQQGGLAFPFGLLDELGAVATVTVEAGGESVLILWDRASQAAVAFESIINNQILTFSAANGRITDDQTGSVWRIDGLATEGPLAGQQLSSVPNAFVAYWFAWPEFYPEIKLWTELQGESE
jgi:hypothetical protein